MADDIGWMQVQSCAMRFGLGSHFAPSHERLQFAFAALPHSYFVRNLTPKLQGARRPNQAFSRSSVAHAPAPAATAIIK